MPVASLLPLPEATTPVDTLLRPADVAAYAGEMPVATAVLPRLQALLQAETTSISDVVDLVLLDPGLAVRLKQVASSVRFGNGQPTDSLAEALLRLGADEVYRLSAAFELSRFLNRPLRAYGLGPAAFWRRSILCALAMVDLAPASGLDERHAYTVGLLHAVGMVFIDRHLRCFGSPHLRLGPVPTDRLPQRETQLVGMHHAQAAAVALRTWGFGEDIVEPIEHQLRPGGSLRHRGMTSLLAEARILAGEIVPDLSAEAAGEAPRRPHAESDWHAALSAQALRIEAAQG